VRLKDCSRCTADANPRSLGARNRSRAPSSYPRAPLQVECLSCCKLYICTAPFLKQTSLCRQSRRQCICHWQNAQCALDSRPPLKTSQASAWICLPCWWSIRRQHLSYAWLELPWWSTGSEQRLLRRDSSGVAIAQWDEDRISNWLKLLG